METQDKRRMGPEAKIEHLIEITGTPKSRRALARSNYMNLLETEGEKAIDDRIAEFEAMHREGQAEVVANDTTSMTGPCCICGATNYALSMGGPTICPKCDC